MVNFFLYGYMALVWGTQQNKNSAKSHRIKGDGIMVNAPTETGVTDFPNRSFQPLICAKCGEPLPYYDSDAATLTCDLCGQGHKSIPPPPMATRSDFEQGEGVAALWGEHWWPAHVVNPAGQGHYWVHYEGWAPSNDELVDMTRIRAIDYVPGSSIIPPTFEKTLKVKRANLFSAAAIVVVILAGVAAFFYWGLGEQVYNLKPDTAAALEAANLGFISGSLPGAELPDDFVIKHGQEFYVKWGPNWYSGTALDQANQKYILIRYKNWDESQDEIVTRDRLRIMR